MKPNFASTLGLLVLAACSPDNSPTESRDTVNSDPELVSQSTQPAPAKIVLVAAIPAAMQGRWGLVPGDCTSQRGDAKGLLVIERSRLKFYESVARLGAVRERSESRIHAAFSFTGEGMDWTRDLTLELAGDGKTLVRREFGAEAAAEPFEYHRCQSQAGN